MSLQLTGDWCKEQWQPPVWLRTRANSIFPLEMSPQLSLGVRRTAHIIAMGILDRTDLRARMSQGTCAAIVVTAFSMLTTGMDDIASNRVLVVTGLVASGIAGAVAGAVYFVTEEMRAQGGGEKTLANVLTLLTFATVVILALVGFAATGLLG